jgi:UDP-hydrolysing UDP-N-acetyl-D-glucosamine 2-epimerase
MTSKRKICFVTGTRADYGLLFWIMKEVQQDQDLELQIVVIGSHLEKKYGLTKDVIISDGLPISHEVPCHLISDRPEAIGNSIADCLKGMLEAFQKIKPDIVVILGDRFEILAVAQACLVLNIPLAHIHGGEATLGVIDEKIRHAVTKMADLHFPANKSYANRIIQMGENPEKVFAFGAPGLDTIKHVQFMNRSELGISLGVELEEKVMLVTYHPVSIDEKISNQEMTYLIDALAEVDPTVQILITMPNADTFSDFIRSSWENFLKVRKNAHSFVSLGQKRYLSLMNECSVVVGNSSSGIVEAPFLAKPVIDIGMRQRGRLASPDHVLRVDSDKKQIIAAILKATGLEFQKRASTPSHLYGTGESANKIKEKLKVIDLVGITFKPFHDLGQV